MTANAAFPTPSPTLANVVTARNAYLAAVTQGQDSRLARSLRKKTRQALVVMQPADNALRSVRFSSAVGESPKLGSPRRSSTRR